jgi:hypothetical protein
MDIEAIAVGLAMRALIALPVYTILGVPWDPSLDSISRVVVILFTPGSIEIVGTAW